MALNLTPGLYGNCGNVVVGIWVDTTAAAKKSRPASEFEKVRFK